MTAGPARRAEARTAREVRPGRTWVDVAAFVAAVLVAGWTPWGWLVLSGREPFAGDGLATSAWFLGGQSPVLAAAVVIAALHRPEGLRRLRDGLLRWRVGRWYAVLLLPVAVATLAVTVVVATGPVAFEPAGPAHLLLLPMLLGYAVVVGGLEEVGWRGYLLPRLQDRLSALGASLLIAAIWSVWHAPLFLIGSTTQASMPWGWFTVQGVGLSVILTWVYNGTGGSVLLTVLFHGAVNAGYSAVVTGLAPAALEGLTAPAALLTVAIAIVIVRCAGPADLARRPRVVWAPLNRVDAVPDPGG
jgi:uncharacterized protein